MKIKQLMKLMLLLASITSCNSTTNNVVIVNKENNRVTVCDGNNLGDKKDIPLSDLVEDFQVIRFANNEDAYFKLQWFAFSENYICINQPSQAPVKLFNKKGEFLGDIGTIGRGPGEYKSAYNILIDEKEGSIYVATMSENKILRFDLTGKFQNEIDLEERLNKPKLFKQSNSDISLVQLCFKDRGDKFTAANIQSNNNDSINYAYFDALATNFRNQDGAGVGFDAEIWSYRNTPDFAFMMTHSDTIYHYNSGANRIESKFTISFDDELKKDHFTIINELPNHYLVFLVGKNGKKILVDKEKQEAFNVSIFNDFMGNMITSLQFQDGYYFANYAPDSFKDKIQDYLDSGDCQEEDITKLTELKNSLNENDNNILLLAKLKN